LPPVFQFPHPTLERGQTLPIPVKAGLGQFDDAVQAVELDLERGEEFVRVAVGAHQRLILVALFFEDFLLLGAQ